MVKHRLLMKAGQFGLLQLGPQRSPGGGLNLWVEELLRPLLLYLSEALDG
jgi:hypothetical protein